MDNHLKQLEEYLTKACQTKQQLFSGAFDHGVDFIINELVPRALEENKKIVWHSEPGIFDGTTYTLEEL